MAATLNNLAQATCGMCDKHPRLRAMLAGVVAVAAGAATAAVVHTDSDGTTFDVTGGTLTVNVPTSGKTNSYDYVANILNNGSYAITDIVKDGPGVLNAKAASAYTGSWTINAGAVRCTANQSLGSTSGTAASKGAVTVKSGAAIKLEVDPCYVLNNRRIFVEGAGDGTAYKSAIVGKAATATDKNGIAGSSIQLTGDTDFWAEGGCTVDIGNSAFDLAGHTFNVCGKDWSWLYFRGGMVATNSNASVDAVVKIPKSTNMKTTLTGLTTWLGGGRNVIDVTGSGRIYIEGKVEGDWTMKLKGSIRGVRTTTPQTTRSSYYIRLPTVINGAVTIGNGDNTNPGYGLELGGSSGVSGHLVAEDGFHVGLGVGARLLFGGSLLDGECGVPDERVGQRCLRDGPIDVHGVVDVVGLGGRLFFRGFAAIFSGGLDLWTLAGLFVVVAAGLAVRQCDGLQGFVGCVLHFVMGLMIAFL